MDNYKTILLSSQKRLSTLDTASVKELIKSCVDHTSLNQADSEGSVTRFVERARDMKIASICVYPSMLEAAGLALGESDIALCAVCGAFPSGQTYLEVKLLEVALAIENGADEIDVVIDLGAIMEGQYDRAKCEIEAIKEEIGDEALLKVIIESGVLLDPEMIYNASMTAIDGGADFIKTSTGKAKIGATAEAVVAICCAIGDHFNNSGVKIGVKVSGGVSSWDEAMTYYAIVEEILGQEWLNPSLFRIGSSKLALL